MGSSASKASRTGGSGVRKYPSRVTHPTTRAAAPPPPPPQQASRPGPEVHPPPQTSQTRTEAIEMDARDPVLASRLTELGAVQPNPHFSPSSQSNFDPRRNTSTTRPNDDMMMPPPESAFPDLRNNPAIRILESRQRIAEEAESELTMVGRRGFEGRKYPDIGVIILALMRRKRGEPDESIEKALGIKKGRLASLGRGIVQSVG